MHKWLIIQFKQIGDVVLTTHLPREIKTLFPNAEIDFLTFEINQQLLSNNPNINNVYTVSSNGGITETISSVWNIRRNKYDVIIDTQNTPRSLYHVIFSRAKYKVGYDKSSRQSFYNNIVSSSAVYAGQIKLNMLKPFDPNFDLSNYDCRPEVFYKESDTQSMRDKVKSVGLDITKPFITISPTHKRDTRRWKFEYFMDTACWLTKTYSFQILLTYGPGEKEYIDNNLNKYKENVDLSDNIIVAPEFSMVEFAAVLSAASMHIGNDSAPHHLAVSQKTPTFIIIGSTSTGWIHPDKIHTSVNLGIDCQPCGRSICNISEDIPCMNDLTFEIIKKDLENFIEDNSINITCS
ncbi:MAG: hypothetical protein C0603_12160 [Denitrovibrio sp.]|nr:MAG: hypothetical protein C0603_12160 [Denitrovibrio sp.]